MSNEPPLLRRHLDEEIVHHRSETATNTAVTALQKVALSAANMNIQDKQKAASIQTFAALPAHLHATLLNASQQLESQRAAVWGQELAGEINPMIVGPRVVCAPPSSTRQFALSPPAPLELSENRPVNAHMDISYHYGMRPQVQIPAVPSGAGYSYVHTPRTRFGDQQSDPIRRIQIQINYLDTLALDVPSHDSVLDEIRKKEMFRLRLIEIAQIAIEKEANARGFEAGPRAVEFRCFGSLRNGFALPGSDMDLTIITRSASFPNQLQGECAQLLMKAFLDTGLGAHLISKARVPIIKLCEKPPAHVLLALKAEFFGHEEVVKEQHSGLTNAEEPSTTTSGLGDGDHANNNKFTGSRIPAFPKSGAGIQCDINFSGRLALYNSELLRCYSLCDERVRTVGLFVKMWAKAREINSPFHGTLCSYGYLLMVIHYLTNIVQPPITPNLQLLYRPPFSHAPEKEVNTVDGCDIRFFKDEYEIRTRIRNRTWAGNCQSAGGLLRGFFAYYGSRGGFDWVNGVVSIRTQGGILTKVEKGWTQGRTDENGIRQKYLIAIEDPFERDHNVGRTVLHHGLDAIRAEFRRAYMIISRIQDIPGLGWEWRNDQGEVGESLLASVGERTSLRRNRPRNTGRVDNRPSPSEAPLHGENNPCSIAPDAGSVTNNQPQNPHDSVIPFTEPRRPGNVTKQEHRKRVDALADSVNVLSL